MKFHNKLCNFKINP